MNPRIQQFAILLSILACLPACGSGSAAEGIGEASRPTVKAKESAGSLPSRRRLESFLPAELNGRKFTVNHSGVNDKQGRCEAMRQYLPVSKKFMSGIELEIGFYRKRHFNTGMKFFATSLGERVKVAGFESAIDETEGAEDIKFDLYIRLSEELWVRASGNGPYERIRDAALAIDLVALLAAAEDGSIFEELEGDRLERILLSRSEVVALLPTQLGRLEQSSSEGRTFFSKDPMHSRARGKYGSGTLSIYDYGRADLAGVIERKIEQNALLAGFQFQTDCVVEKEQLAVNDGRGEWAWTENVKASLQPALVMHLVRGRFLLEYEGLFVKSQPLPDSVTPQLRVQAEKLNRETGADTFKSIEEQRDAILAYFEALDLEQPKN